MPATASIAMAEPEIAATGSTRALDTNDAKRSAPLGSDAGRSVSDCLFIAASHWIEGGRMGVVETPPAWMLGLWILGKTTINLPAHSLEKEPSAWEDRRLMALLVTSNANDEPVPPKGGIRSIDG